LRRFRIRPAFAAGLPAAVVGALAAALTGPAAVAAEPDVRIEKRESGIRLIAASAPATYVVKKGDTVSGIAARYGLRTADILARNGLAWSSVIHPGQVLTLRGPAKAAPAHRAAPASKAAPAPSYRVYAVKRGDTVSAIAKRAGVSVQRVLSANKLTWSSIIYPGQRLRIPAATSAPAAKAPAAKKASAPTPEAKGTHTVRGGDTVWAIATRYGVSVDAVLRANGLSRSSIIYPGQKLAIPGATTASGPAKSPTKSTKGSAKTVTLNAEQQRNAKLIITVGRRLGVPERGIAIALGTAMQESSLRNLSWGDRDSRGLFQQRPSTGWGTVAQVQNAERSIRVFFGGAKDPNGSRTRGLLDIRGWQKMSFAQAAQAVQISAYPDRYARWEDDAYAWLRALG
jgi:LysM repeat protein